MTERTLPAGAHLIPPEAKCVFRGKIFDVYQWPQRLYDGSTATFEMLRRRGIAPRAPQRAFATPDHYVPTDSRDMDAIADPERRGMAPGIWTKRVLS